MEVAMVMVATAAAMDTVAEIMAVNLNKIFFS